MANTYKNIVITPNRDTDAANVPVIRFSGGDATTNTDINVRVYTTQNGTLSFEGSAGQLFSITNDLTGSIFSVNDVSGIPSIDVDAAGIIELAPFGGNVGIGTTNVQHKLDVAGTANINGTLFVYGTNVGSTLTSSFSQANTARTHANASFLNANAAYVQANTARDHANAAFTSSNTKVSSVSGTSGRISSSGGTTPAIDLSTAGAGAATYSSGISSLTVDAYGRVTSVTGSAGYVTSSGVTSVSGTGTVSGLTLTGTVTTSGSLTLGGVINPQFSGDSVTKDDITTRTDSGIYESASGTTAEGWPVNSASWHHLIAATHSNDANYYSMQIAATFYDQDWYFRNTNGSGTTGWSKVWHNNNDGASSGLDADLLDGLQASQFMRTDAVSTHTTGKFTVYTPSGVVGTVSSTDNLEIFQPNAGSDAFLTFHISGDYAANFGIDGTTNDLFYGGWSAGANKYRVWHAGNDGTTSGLDADLLDGQHGSYYGIAADVAAAFAKANTGGSVTISTDARNITTYIMFEDSTSGALANANVSTSLTFNPSTGTLSSTIFNSTSDKTLKYDIEPIKNALVDIDTISGVKFKWVNNDHPSMGVIAQEVEKVFPELINNDNEIKTVNYNGIIAVLIQAVKELKAEVEELKRR